MARIDIKSAGATLNDGVLQLENGVAMDTTLRNVADQNNTTSPLKLSTTAVQVVSPFRITTDDPSDMYLDCEDGATNNRFNITRNTASQQVNLNFASNPGGSTTTVGAIRTFTDGVNLGEVVKFREDGQVTFTERVNVEADSLVTTETCSVIAASTTDANLVIAPNGTGALIASIPDGTATGGNARGINAVDLQTFRSTTANVASGDFSTIIGGSSCTASGQYSIVGGLGSSSSNYAGVTFGNANTNNSYGGVVSGGQNNTGGNASYVTISGGRFNNTTGSTNGVISGGISNTVSSNYSTISGGQSNTASTSTHATVCGGFTNTASGGYSTVSGGQSNVASGNYAFAHGFQTVASALGSGALNNGIAASNYSMAINAGSVAATVSDINGTYAFAHGASSRAYLYAMQANAGGSFSGFGQSQQSNVTARRQDTLTTGGTTTLSLDGTGTTNFAVPEGQNRSWNVQVRWVAVVTAITGTATGVTVGDTKTSTDLLAVAKRGGVTTVSAHTSAGTHAIETIAGSLTAANIAYTAGASQQMAITFTGPTFAGGGSVTMRVVAAISLTEVAY